MAGHDGFTIETARQKAILECGLVLVIALAVCACGGPSGAGPSGRAAGNGAGLVAVWTVEGSTDEPSLHHTTHFNDPGAPRLKPGPTWLAWSCDGAGVLAVDIVFVAGHGAVPPPSIPAELALTLPCPATGSVGQATLKQFTRPALGAEDAIVIRPAVQPMGAVHYRIQVLQAPSAP